MSARLLSIALDLFATTFVTGARHPTSLLHGKRILRRLGVSQSIILFQRVMAGRGVVVFVGIEERVGGGRGVVLVRIVGMRRTGSGCHEGSWEGS